MNERLNYYEEKMQKAYNHLEMDYSTIRAGRANPHVLDKIKVDYTEPSSCFSKIPASSPF